MFAMRLPEAMEYHLDLASAAHGLSRSEYVRLAVSIALNAEPDVTPELAAKMFAMAGKTRHQTGTHDKQRDLVDA